MLPAASGQSENQLYFYPITKDHIITIKVPVVFTKFVGIMKCNGHIRATDGLAFTQESKSYCGAQQWVKFCFFQIPKYYFRS